MPALIVHLTVVDRLAQEARGLPADLMRSLHEDLEYARFGAALPDLPYFDGVRGAIRELRQGAHLQVPAYAHLWHSAAPVRLGLKLAELVASGSLVGSHAGQAIVAGYFTHLVLDRAVHPITELVASRLRKPGESSRAAHRRVEWLQASLYLRATYGRDLIGSPSLEEKLKVLKRRGPPFAGVGRGLYEMVRLASLEVLQVAPSKEELDSWVWGLYLYGRALASPLGRQFAPGRVSPATYRHAFEGSGIDVVAEIERGLREARTVAARVHAYMSRGEFSARAAGRFLAEYPEGHAGALEP